HASLESLTTDDHRALTGGPGPDLALARASREVRLRLRPRHPAHLAARAYLPLEQRPVEAHGGAGVFLEVTPLVALVVGEEDEAPGVDAAQEDHPGRGLARGRRGGEDHRVGLGMLRLDGVTHPALDLAKR